MSDNNDNLATQTDGSPSDDAKEPNASDIQSRVQAVIDKAINPALAMHGGYVKLLEVRGSTAVVEMGGCCQGCVASQMTLRAGIEAMIVEEVSEVTEVVDGTDHGAGTNPYYE